MKRTLFRVEVVLITAYCGYPPSCISTQFTESSQPRKHSLHSQNTIGILGTHGTHRMVFMDHLNAYQNDTMMQVNRLESNLIACRVLLTNYAFKFKGVKTNILCHPACSNLPFLVVWHIIGHSDVHKTINYMHICIACSVCSDCFGRY